MPPRNISSTPSLVPHSTKSGVTLRASARGPTATIESPRMATAPSSITRRCASMVTTVPPVTSKSTLSLADAVEERTKAVRQHISAENTRLGQLLQKQNLFLFCIFPLARGKSLQKCGIKGPRQQFRSALARELASQV